MVVLPRSAAGTDPAGLIDDRPAEVDRTVAAGPAGLTDDHHIHRTGELHVAGLAVVHAEEDIAGLAGLAAQAERSTAGLEDCNPGPQQQLHPHHSRNLALDWLVVRQCYRTVDQAGDIHQVDRTAAAAAAVDVAGREWNTVRTELQHHHHTAAVAAALGERRMVAAAPAVREEHRMVAAGRREEDSTGLAVGSSQEADIASGVPGPCIHVHRTHPSRSSRSSATDYAVT